MNDSAGDHGFAGSIPALYDRLLVPLIFEPYAIDLAARCARLRPHDVLELAAGTGALTRHLAATLPDAAITATDLNQAMLDRAAAVGTARPVTWRQADAMQLPFDDGAFDIVVIQFGVMFFPDRVSAYAETRRVLRPGGTLLFNVWDDIAANAFAATVTEALAPLFADDPPRFLARVPHGYHDQNVIARDLADGGFATPAQFETITARSRADAARTVAVAMCQGTPLRNDIVARGAEQLDAATDAATEALEARFGRGAVDGEIRAIVVSVTR